MLLATRISEAAKKPRLRLIDPPLVLGQAVARLPQRDVGLHRDFGRHPVIVAAGEVFLPRPAYFSGSSWFTSARQLIIALSSTDTRAPPRSIAPRPVASAAPCGRCDRARADGSPCMRQRQRSQRWFGPVEHCHASCVCLLAGFAGGVVDGARGRRRSAAARTATTRR